MVELRSKQVLFLLNRNKIEDSQLFPFLITFASFSFNASTLQSSLPTNSILCTHVSICTASKLQKQKLSDLLIDFDWNDACMKRNLFPTTFRRIIHSQIIHNMTERERKIIGDECAKIKERENLSQLPGT